MSNRAELGLADEVLLTTPVPAVRRLGGEFEINGIVDGPQRRVVDRWRLDQVQSISWTTATHAPNRWGVPDVSA